ncbi:uncharacterized protein N7473_003141 [Penicillium subrubescens]|uniref:uncharacterized protein n=1 Tax=Penicillium subrubescens TaxID=1316194 RepID=UPI002545AA7C|nr:uncharacterized protein N7473_003141 [Penicillium subrubescens]KAJ5906225.1 hypothetical protein N7473_003141 [Penicillium subrubescens]
MGPDEDIEVVTGMRRSLLELPNEILQRIAGFLPADQDLRNLNLVCRELRDRVLAPESTLWRTRFNEKYDLPKGRNYAELKMEYQTRAIVLPQTIDFRQEASEHQTLWLEVLQGMLLESLTLPLRSDVSKTYERIRETLTKSDLLEHPWREDPSERFCTVQLCLTSLALTLDPADATTPAVRNKCTRSKYDIATVYSHEDKLDGPFIDHENLDLAPLLHIRSFWQRHLLNKAEQTYHESFARLAEALRPQARKANGDSSILSVSWLGYYSCLHPMPASRKDFEDQETCADLRGDHLTQVEIMTLDLHIEPDKPFWPDQCKRIIPLHDGPNTIRTYLRGTQSTLNGDPADNPVFGFTETIARPYGGFPGWTRICFAICEESDDISDQDDEMAMVVDADDGSDDTYRWVHGYEGVILPGGRIKLGRWMDLKNMDASGRGPFIFWDV